MKTKERKLLNALPNDRIAQAVKFLHQLDFHFGKMKLRQPTTRWDGAIIDVSVRCRR